MNVYVGGSCIVILVCLEGCTLSTIALPLYILLLRSFVLEWEISFHRPHVCNVSNLFDIHRMELFLANYFDRMEHYTRNVYPIKCDDLFNWPLIWITLHTNIGHGSFKLPYLRRLSTVSLDSVPKNFFPTNTAHTSTWMSTINCR